MEDPTISKGKIGSLPHELREELCRRMLDGADGPELLAWLNAHPVALDVWRRKFEGAPLTPQNLSDFRRGDFARWCARRRKTEDLKSLSSFARDLVGAGGNIADGAAAILSGQILEALELAANFAATGGSDDAEADPAAGLAKMAQAVAALQTAGVQRQRLDLAKRDADRKAEELLLAKARFQRQTVEQFVKWARSPDAAKILESGKPSHVQMDLLRELMFGAVSNDAGKEGSPDVP